MNDCFLTKWILKIFHEPDELWFKIVKAKYMDEDGFFGSKTKGGLPVLAGASQSKAPV
jgi:hypothetical protein